LKGQCFLRSGVGKRANVEKEDERFLAQVVGELDVLTGAATTRRMPQASNVKQMVR
jgi:hypothetical protein